MYESVLTIPNHNSNKKYVFLLSVSKDKDKKLIRPNILHICLLFYLNLTAEFKDLIFFSFCIKIFMCPLFHLGYNNSLMAPFLEITFRVSI